MDMNRINGLALFCMACSALCVDYGWAAQVDGTLATDLEYSDNVGRAPTNKQEDVIHTVSINALIEEQRKNVQASANFRAEHSYYLNNSFEDQTSITSGIGLVNFGFIESFLDWRSSFTRIQVLNDATAEDLPDNREYRNVTETGPVFSYSLSPTVSSSLSATYTSVENSDEDVSDSERVNGQWSLNYQYNPVTSLFFNSTYEDVIDGDELAEYTNRRLSTGLSRLFSKGQLSFEVGRGKISSDSGQVVDSTFIEAGLTHEDFWWHTFRAEYSQNTSDTSIGFNQLPEEGFQDGRLRGVSRNDIVARKQIEASLSRDLVSLRYELGLLWESESFEGANINEAAREVSILFDQSVTAGFNVNYAYRFRKTDFGRSDVGTDRLSTYQVGFTQDITRTLAFSGSLEFAHRRNSDSSGREYEELSTMLSLNWLAF